MNDQGVVEQFDVLLFSFGFKYGTPEDANMLFDVRFLPNPYWEEDMRQLTGRDDTVAAYVLESPEGRQFLTRVLPLLEFVIRCNCRAGKMPMHIGIGCTGGHHRSVAVVEKLGSLLQDETLLLRVCHRDIDKE